MDLLLIGKKLLKSIYGDSIYVDVDNIKKHNGLVHYWMLADLLEPVDGGSLGIANSAIEKYKVNCVEEKQTQLNLTYYSQSMGRGKILLEDTPNKILYPKPKSVAHIGMKFVCDY